MGANQNPALMSEIGPDGLAREAPVIAYTEQRIEAEKLQLKKYIEENYSKIRDVERELANLTFEMKLTTGSKNAAFEHMRKKIEVQNEKIHAAKVKEEQARKVWEAASKIVRDEEAVKQKLCEDLNQLVQESSNTQYTRLEELKRRLEALNPSRGSVSMPTEVKEDTSAQISTSNGSVHASVTATEAQPNKTDGAGNIPASNDLKQQSSADEVKGKKKSVMQGRGRGGIGAMPKGRGGNLLMTPGGWTGSGFNVDDRS